MPRAALIGAVALLVTVAVAGAGLVGSAEGASFARQEQPPVEIGAGPVGEPALRFVGRVRYAADRVLLFGYFESVTGLDPASTTSDGSRPSPETARFTFLGEAAVDDRADVSAMATVAGTGSVRVAFDDVGGATWDDPASFGDGLVVAEWELELHDAILSQGAGRGSVVGDERVRQISADPFDFGNDRYRFGHTGLEQRVRFAGALAGDGAVSNEQAADVIGSVIVTARVPNPSLDETEAEADADATPVATPVPSDCTGVEAWSGATLARTVPARALADAAREAVAKGDVDAAATAAEAAIEALPQIVSDQRVEPAPADAATADRLAVTALSTLERGVRLVAAATAAGDEAALAQGRAVLDDGGALLDRAEDALFELQTRCAE